MGRGGHTLSAHSRQATLVVGAAVRPGIAAIRCACNIPSWLNSKYVGQRELSLHLYHWLFLLHHRGGDDFCLQRQQTHI